MYKQITLHCPGRREKFQRILQLWIKGAIDSGIFYFRIETKSKDMEASMSTAVKTVIWNYLPLRNKYNPHKNKNFFDSYVHSELYQSKQSIKT
jgi:hypothetical protein